MLSKKEFEKNCLNYIRNLQKNMLETRMEDLEIIIFY